MAKKPVSSISLPSVLAYSRTFNPSDGFMFSCKWPDKLLVKDEKIIPTLLCKPISVIEKAILGTNSSRVKENGKAMEYNSANPQLIESARLPKEHDALLIEFGLICVPFCGPHSCNNSDFEVRLKERMPELLEKEVLIPVLRRMVKNLLYGAHGWRNRMNGDCLRTEIYSDNLGDDKDTLLVSCDLSNYDDIRFDEDQSLLQRGAEDLVQNMYKALTKTDNRISPLKISVKTLIHLGRGAEVFPSQDFVAKDRFAPKDNSKPSKYLYKVTDDRQAGLHSQKIGNALRTIDTWYPEDENNSIPKGTPFSVEPFGAVPTRGLALRRGGRDGVGKDFFTLFDNFFLSDEPVDYSFEDKMYMISVIFRGGVFGGDSEDKKEKGKKNEVSVEE